MAGYRGAESSRPANDAIAVTPSDATVIPVTRGLYVGTTGTLIVRTANGNNATFTNVAVGYHPLQVDMVLATGTTALGILALY
jgi:hypothetical protein